VYRIYCGSQRSAPGARFTTEDAAARLLAMQSACPDELPLEHHALTTRAGTAAACGLVAAARQRSSRAAQPFDWIETGLSSRGDTRSYESRRRRSFSAHTPRRLDAWCRWWLEAVEQSTDKRRMRHTSHNGALEQRQRSTAAVSNTSLERSRYQAVEALRRFVIEWGQESYNALNC
jgi:hypothetical protein